MTDPVACSLIRIQRLRLTALRRALAPYGYTGSMHLILNYAARCPGASQEEIACFYALDKTSVARDAKKLEALGHIVRKPAPGDRRQNQLCLTEEGGRFIETMRAISDAYTKKMSAGISPADWQALIVILKRIETNCLD